MVIILLALSRWAFDKQSNLKKLNPNVVAAHLKIAVGIRIQKTCLQSASINNDAMWMACA